MKKIGSRIISTLIFMSIIFSFLPNANIKAYTDTSDMIDIKDYSSNTQANQYKITDDEGLSQFSTLVNGGTNFSGQSIYLSNNILFNRGVVNNFNTIGSYSTLAGAVNRSFNGTFDGNNYTISGININNSSADFKSLLFANLNGATVRNLTLSNSTITARYNVGGVATNCVNSNIDNCIVDGTVNIRGINDVSAIAGDCNATSISNCSNSALINGQNFEAGIALELLNGSSVNSCINNSYIRGSSYGAGICLTNYSGSITSCYNLGNINFNNAEASGIVTYNYGQVSKCYNSANIKGLSYVGGICAISATGTVSDCYNTGNIATAEQANGGIIGYNDSSIRNSYNVGSVQSGQSSGGVIGYNTTAISNIVNCYYLNTNSYSGIGTGGSTTAQVYPKSSEEMQTNEFAYNLNSTNFTTENSRIWTRNDRINNGYPIFASSNNAISKLTILNNDINGTISYNNVGTGDTYVVSGSNVNLTITPESGYSLTGLTINGVTTNNTTGQFIMPNEDSTVSPIFSMNTVYTISVDTDGGTFTSGTSIPTEYTVVSPDIILPTSSEIIKNGYNFEGWYDNSAFSGSPITVIPTGSTGDITLYAKWSDPINYSISFETNGGTIDQSYVIPTQYTVQSPTITLPTDSQVFRQGYKFAGWYEDADFSGDVVTEIPTGSFGNKTFYANWAVLDSYNITIETNGGIISTDVVVPASYTEQSPTIVLPISDQIIRNGYSFEGWYDNADFDGEPVTEIPTGSTGNKMFYARWSNPINYSIIIETNGGTINESITIPTQYNVESPIITLPGANDVSRTGYAFQGWFNNLDFTGNPITEIPTGSYGNITLYAKWGSPVQYSILVNTNGGTVSPEISIPGQYTIESPTIILPTETQITRPGYEFQGWYDNADFNGSRITEIPTGSYGNVVLYANWGTPINYSVTLNLNGGNIDPNLVIPTQYNVESDSITLPTADEITRNGYSFEGWYDNSIFAGNRVTEIPTGSTGNKVFYARWSNPIEYSITVETNGGSLSPEVSIPNQYTILSDTITLPTAGQITRAGYKFAGWYNSSDFSGSPITEIPTGSFGNITLYANWTELDSFSITLVTNGGTVNDDVVVPTSYTEQSSTIILPTSSEITRIGYEFEGWYDNSEFEGESISEIPTGSSGNKTFYARWSLPINYNIDIETNGGIIDTDVIVPDQYNVESETIILPTSDQITRNGYLFLGWYETADFSGSLITEIPTGSTGDKTFYARWSDAVIYTINLKTNGGTIDSTITVPTEYTVTSDNISLPDASEITRIGYNFEGWYETSDFSSNAVTEIPTGSFGDKVFYAKWSDPIVYTITYEPNGGTLNAGVVIPSSYTISSDTIMLPTASDISREYSGFIGWYTNPNFSGSRITQIPTGTTEDIKLYAKWNTLDIYNIIVNTNGGTLNEDVFIPSEYTNETPNIVLPTASQITKIGYNFEGWYNNPNFIGSQILEIPTGSNGKINLYARWSNPIEYSITVETNGGTFNEGVTIPSSYTVASDTIVLPTASEIIRENYIFAGWYTNAEFSGNAITEIPTGSSGNITIYAKWTQSSEEKNNNDTKNSNGVNNNSNGVNNNNNVSNINGVNNNNMELGKGKFVSTGDSLKYIIPLIIFILAAISIVILCVTKKKNNK